MTGVIIRLREGFGFIRPDDQSSDVFFHASGLQKSTKAFADLTPGLKVEFTPIDAPKGPRAIEIRVL